jgi:O-antigen/teichoic acid export membrane protein
MTLTKRLFSGFFNYGLGQFLPKLINFLLIPVYAFYLVPEELGVYDIFYTLFSFLLIVMRLNLPGAIIRFYYDYQDDADRLGSYIKTIYVGVIFSSVIIGLIFFVFKQNVITLLGAPAHADYLLIVIGCAILAGSGDVQKRLLQVREQSAYSAKLNVATTLVSIVLSVFFVMVLGYGARGLFYAMLISSAAFFIQAQYYLKDDLKRKIDTTLLPSSFKYSMGIFPYLVIGHLNPVILKSFLANVVSSSAVGIFSMASRVTSPQLLIISAFSSTITPIYFSILKEGKGDFAEYKKNVRRVILLAFMVMIAFVSLAPPAIEIFLPIAYKESANVVAWLSLGFMPQILYILVSQDIFYSKKTLIVSVVNVLGMLLSLLTSFLLIPVWEQGGLAI